MWSSGLQRECSISEIMSVDVTMFLWDSLSYPWRTINHFSVIKTHFTAADKLKQHGSPGLLRDLQVSQLPTEATGASHRLLTLGYSWTEAGWHKDSSARVSLEPLVGAHGDCTKCFGSRRLATNTTFPGHFAAGCAQPVTLTRAHGPRWPHSYPRARTAREIGLPVFRKPAQNNTDGLKTQMQLCFKEDLYRGYITVDNSLLI